MRLLCACCVPIFLDQTFWKYPHRVYIRVYSIRYNVSSSSCSHGGQLATITSSTCVKPCSSGGTSPGSMLFSFIPEQLDLYDSTVLVFVASFAAVVVGGTKKKENSGEVARLGEYNVPGRYVISYLWAFEGC